MKFLFPYHTIPLHSGWSEVLNLLISVNGKLTGLDPQL
jgi:hypothetical protein